MHVEVGRKKLYRCSYISKDVLLDKEHIGSL